MLWHIPEDMAFFRRKTMGCAVIMGRKTWESLPVKPLGGRFNIVITRQGHLGDLGDLGDLVCATPAQALEAARTWGAQRSIYGIGGAQLYEALLPLAERLLITWVDGVFEGADAFFPPFSPTQWQCLGKHQLRVDPPACAVHEYRRK